MTYDQARVMHLRRRMLATLAHCRHLWQWRVLRTTRLSHLTVTDSRDFLILTAFERGPWKNKWKHYGRCGRKLMKITIKRQQKLLKRPMASRRAKVHDLRRGFGIDLESAHALKPSKIMKANGGASE